MEIALNSDKPSLKDPVEFDNSSPMTLQNWPGIPGLSSYAGNTGNTQVKPVEIVLNSDKPSLRDPLEFDNSSPRALQNWPGIPGLSSYAGNTGGTQAIHR